jgi:hypothetical protein
MPARACLARNGAADLEGVVLAMDEVGQRRCPTVLPGYPSDTVQAL